MSPDQIPQKEGEPASERIAHAEFLLEMGCYPGDGRVTPVALSPENYDALRKLLADAKQRAVAQEAEGRRLRKHLELADEVIDHFTWCRFCGEDSPKECGVGGENYLAWQARFSPPEGGAALSGSSETGT